MWNVPMSFTARFNSGIVLDNELYKKYKRMIQKAAWQATKVCTESYDELLSRGNLLFCEATKSYNPGKGAFSTHLTWKLLTLKQTASEMYAPKTCKEERTFWNSLGTGCIGKDGEEISGDPLMASEQYSTKMAEDCEADSWESRLPDFRPYIDAMDEDTRQLCTDILDGVFDDPEKLKVMGNKAYMRSMTNIPTSRFYSKRYVKLGWTKARTQGAVDNLRQMCRQWIAGKLPSKLKKSTVNDVESLF